jgi:PleD family two-component response regulator
MGGAEAGVDGTGIEALVEAADRRLYEAKAAGRDRLG